MKDGKKSLAAVAGLMAAFFLYSCPNTLLDRAKHTQDLAASSKIVLSYDGEGIEAGGILDLGSMVVGSDPQSVEILVSNRGAADLAIDVDRISLVKAEDTENDTFSISSRPEASLAEGTSASLVLLCAAKGLGQKSATVTIPTNDVRHAGFVFVIKLAGRNEGKYNCQAYRLHR
jgi:hypothetical protein